MKRPKTNQAHRNQARSARHGSEQAARRQAFIWLGTLASILAVISLSSCAAVTSGHSEGSPGTSSAGILTPSATTLSFGSTAAGSNSTQTLSFTNTGTATVNIDAASISGAGFRAVGGSPLSVIGVGQSGTLQIQFAPPSAGAVTGSLTIASDAANGPLTISLSGIGTQASLGISPASLNFGNLTVGQNSTQTVKLTNSGNVNLVVNTATLTGAGLSMTGLTLPATISGGQSVSFSVQFAPTTAGGVSGSIVFADNATDSPQTLLLSGSGVAANTALVANPGSFSFGNVAVGANSTQSISLMNNTSTSITITAGSASGLGFSLTGLAFPTVVAAGQSASFTAQFAPTAAGSASGSVTITSNATNPTVTIPLSGTGTQGKLTANPTSVVFGSLAIGSTASIAVTVTNSGTASVTVSQASASGSGFSISGLATPVTLNAGQGTSFTATFAPTSVGAVSGSISIASNAPGSPLAIPMSGTGTQPPQPQLSANPTSAAFGNVSVGNSNSQTISLSNGGNASVTITQNTLTGAGFSTSGLSSQATIAAGGTAAFNVVFTPTAAGAVSGTLTLVSNSVTSPLKINLTGTGVASTELLGANPTTLPFGSVNDGSTGSLTVTLQNNGNSNVTISGVTVTGAGYSATGVSSGLILTPSQTATLTVTFAPTTGGALNGSVSVASNATNSPTAVSLTGMGVSTSGHSVGLGWDPSASSGVTGYFVYRGTTNGGPYTKVNSTQVASTSYSDTSVAGGQEYFYVVTAIDSSDVESAFSNQVSATTP
jgi:hypothetical protein